MNVALKSEQTDAAIAALERIDDPEALAAIAQRARNKVAARRARDAGCARSRRRRSPRREAAVAGVGRGSAARDRVCCVAPKAWSRSPIPTRRRASLAAARLAWAELQADVELEAALCQQFEAASDAVREAIARAPAGTRGRTRSARGRLRGSRPIALAIVRGDRDADRADDAQDRIAELKVAWDALPPMPSEYAASLTRRFQDACRAFEDRERRRTLAAAAAGRLQTLATELEQLVASDQPVEEIVARWRGLRRDADVLREHASANPEAAERLERAIAALEEKEQEHQQVRVKQEQDNLRRLQQICRQVETLVAASEQLTLKAGDRALREIRAALEERAPLAVEAGSAGDPGAPRGGARQARAARAGAARRRRVAAVGQPPGAGRAVA